MILNHIIMKKSTALLIIGAVIIALIVIVSCRKEDVELPSKSGAVTMPKAGYIDCQSQCILKGSGQFYAKDTSVTVLWGGASQNKFTKIVDLRVYNTETDFVFMFKSTQAPQNLYIDGVLILSTARGSEGVWTSYSIPLPAGWKACDLKEYNVSIDGQGAPALFKVSYQLIGICPACEESFSFVDNGDSSYTFTYIPKEEMIDAFIEFTFPQGIVVSAPAGWTQPGNGHVRQIHRNLVACEPFVFTFKLVHKENGFGPLWTDFKVNGISRN